MEKYQPLIINDFSGGWNPKWALNATQLLVNQSPYMVNADYAARFALTKRRGVTKVGDSTAGAGGIWSLWKHAKLDGTEYLLRSYSTFVQSLVAGVWTNLQTGLSANAKFDNVSIGNTTYFGNAVNDFAYWDGTTLTTSGTNPKGNIYANGFFRLWIAGVTANPHRLYYSQTNGPTAFSAGDSGSTDFPSVIRALKSFYTRDGQESLQVFLANGDIFDIGFDTVGIYKRRIRLNVGAVNQRCVKQLENYNFTVDIFSNVRGIGYEENKPDIRADSKSAFIEDYLRTLTFTNACATYKDKTYILSFHDANASTNNLQLAYSETYDSWRLYSGIGANDYAIYGGDLHFASSSDLNVYKFDSENYSDDDVAIYFRYDTRDLDVGDPMRFKEARYVKVSGFISAGCEVTFRAYIDGDTANPMITRTISGDGNYVSTANSYPWGSSPWASIPFAAFGGTTSTIEVRSFWVAIGLPGGTVPFDKIRFSFENSQKDVDFIITEIKPLIALQAEEKIPLTNQL